jgi:hypothetical protein
LPATANNEHFFRKNDRIIDAFPVKLLCLLCVAHNYSLAVSTIKEKDIQRISKDEMPVVQI